MRSNLCVNACKHIHTRTHTVCTPHTTISTNSDQFNQSQLCDVRKEPPQAIYTPACERGPHNVINLMNSFGITIQKQQNKSLPSARQRHHTSTNACMHVHFPDDLRFEHVGVPSTRRRTNKSVVVWSTSTLRCCDVVVVSIAHTHIQSHCVRSA